MMVERAWQPSGTGHPQLGLCELSLTGTDQVVSVPYIETSSPMQTKTDRVPIQANMKPYISPAGPPLNQVGH